MEKQLKELPKVGSEDGHNRKPVLGVSQRAQSRVTSAENRPSTAGSVSSAASSRHTTASNVFTYRSRPSSGVPSLDPGRKSRPGTASSTVSSIAERNHNVQAELSKLVEQDSALDRSGEYRIVKEAGHGRAARVLPGSAGRIFKGRTGLRPKVRSLYMLCSGVFLTLRFFRAPGQLQLVLYQGSGLNKDHQALRTDQ